MPAHRLALLNACAKVRSSTPSQLFCSYINITVTHDCIFINLALPSAWDGFDGANFAGDFANST
ncbi:hypothetical protein [Desulfuribacillus alkaliarsenatis]|uniref:Uncharacterized protein n=1 Tax=Desulfuribacillus alkaliarsenatis TaxID=766136 RepID=A0A1E5G417_9FIRM|nr:hypothetical protein [Desulfuribacillus alkaliarsenatis]OEF97815.1 hypothetical protein BHF68_13355 [Desulfuribacillus alkaliarsenatis]